MDENKKILFIVGGVFLLAIAFQIFSTYIPSLIAANTSEEVIEKTLSIPEKIQHDLQKALDQYIEHANKVEKSENKEVQNSQNIKQRKLPDTFSDFVIYDVNDVESSKLNLNKYKENFQQGTPIKGLQSKTLVIKLKKEGGKKPITVVYLLNRSLVSLTQM